MPKETEMEKRRLFIIVCALVLSAVMLLSACSMTQIKPLPLPGGESDTGTEAEEPVETADLESAEADESGEAAEPSYVID